MALMYLAPNTIAGFAAKNRSVSSQDDVAQERLDREKYIYVLMAFTITIVITATITMVLAYMQHACAMLKITW